MSHFYLTIWIPPGCFGSDLLNSISISSTFCSKILSSETSNSAATGTLSGLDFWPATPRLSSHVPPLCLSLYLGADLAEGGPRSRETMDKWWSSTHGASWWEGGASGRGTGCFLCPTSACTSVCPLARGPDEPLRREMRKEQRLKRSHLETIDRLEDID